MRHVIERILNLLAFLLTIGRPVPVDEIRTTVAGYDQDSDEAFRRMFERDKELLRRLGIPVRVKAIGTLELETGYVIDPTEYRLPDPGLTDEERAALWLSAQVVRIGGNTAAADALLKLGGSRTTSASEPFGADLGSEVDALADLYQAVIERRFVEFSYHERPRRVAPHGIGHRMGHWYLAGVEKEATKVFRVDRMDRLEVKDPAFGFVRSPEVTVRKALASHPWESGSEADLEVVVHFDPSVAWWADRRLADPIARRVEPDGSVVVTLRVSHVDAFLGWLLGFGAEAEVLSPPEMRKMMIDRVSGAS